MANTPQWTILGPGGGGAQFHPTLSPHDPNCALIGCDMTGSYITQDAGDSWRMFNLRSPARFFVFDPAMPNVLYAGARGLWRSDDTGQTWNLVYPSPADVTGIQMFGDHAEPRYLPPEINAQPLTALALNPANPQTLYAAIGTAEATRLCVSLDWGKTWNTLAPLPDGGRKIFVDPRAPHQHRVLYVVGRTAVTRYEDGKCQQGASPTEETLLDVTMGFPGNAGAPTAYAVASRSLFVSDDGGMAWRKSALPGEGGRYVVIAASLHHPETAYLSYQRLRVGEETCFGVAKTTDGGRSWELVWKETSAQKAANLEDAWITETFGPSWGENPLGLGVSPNDPDLCYATDYGRTLRTDDGGKTWRAVYAKRLPDNSYVSTGLDVTNCYGVHFDPFDSKRLFITYTDIGLFRSENGGYGWLPSSAGVPRRWINTAYWAVFDPDKQGRMWVVMSGIHDLPRPKMWRTQKLSNYNGGVCRSEDGGRSWTLSNAEMPETAATHILLDPRSPAGARALYVTGYGRGVFKSVDDGKTWTLKNAGIEGEEPMAWRLTQDKEGALYLVVARRDERGEIGGAGDGALYRSMDSAEHWTKLPLPTGVNGPNALTVDPEDSQRLYLSAWGRAAEGQAADGGIYLSTDSGATWRNVLSKDLFIYDVTVDPRHPHTLYACGFGSSVWKSTNRGETWRRIQGYNFKWGHRVVPDPRDPRMIYVTTFGGSLWHGPADGDPDAAEDIVTPALRYNISLP